MTNINISTKLIILVVISSVITLFIGFYGVNNLSKVNDGMSTMYKDRVLPLSHLNEVANAYMHDVVEATIKVRFGLITSRDGIRLIEDANKKITENWKAYIDTKIEGDEISIMKETDGLMKEALFANQQILEILAEKNDSTMRLQLEIFIEQELYKKINPFLGKITELTEFQIKVADEIDINGEDVYTTSRQNSYFLMFVGVFIALLLSTYIILGINRSLKKANQTVKKVANGDLTFEIEVSSTDEIGILMENLRVMSDKLKEIISFVFSSSENVAAASQQLSQGATEQATSTEEVSSSMEEMSSNIQQTTDNSMQTEKIATKVANDIIEGSNAVNQTVDAMKIIAEKISIISEIARKTDLLAINAAIEAARAGEHGKGFAVVASEVRKLAENTQNAAKEIDEVSKRSVSIAVRSGELLTQIVPSIQNTSKLVLEITASSSEQRSGIDQINNAIQQLNQVTQENAAASEELSGQAEQLLDSIEFFKIEASIRNKSKSKLKHVEISHLTNKNKKIHGIELSMQDHHKDDGFEAY